MMKVTVSGDGASWKDRGRSDFWKDMDEFARASCYRPNFAVDFDHSQKMFGKGIMFFFNCIDLSLVCVFSNQEEKFPDLKKLGWPPRNFGRKSFFGSTLICSRKKWINKSVSKKYQNTFWWPQKFSKTVEVTSHLLITVFEDCEDHHTIFCAIHLLKCFIRKRFELMTVKWWQKVSSYVLVLLKGFWNYGGATCVFS